MKIYEFVAEKVLEGMGREEDLIKIASKQKKHECKEVKMAEEEIDEDEEEE